MRELNRKSKTELQETVSIPPLQLADIQLQSQPIRYRPTKEPPSFLKIAKLNNNEDFLKEKSLYRYTISRKLSRNSFNKSQTCFVPNSTLKHNKSQLDMEIEHNKTVGDFKKQHSEISRDNCKGASRQRHFRRKSRNESSEGSFHQSTSKENIGQTIKQEKTREQFKQICQNCQSQVRPLRIANNQLKRQVGLLKEQNMRFRKDMDEKNKTIQMLNQQNKKLMRDLKKTNPIHNDKFINDHKLENEVVKRGIFIKQLQQKVKYLELQNLTLKKVKKEKDQQVSIIQKLQRKNRQLENKLRIMSALRTKRNRLKGSMMSSCSQISLNLSADYEEDEMEKIYDALRSTERTIQKVDIPDRKPSLFEKQMDEIGLFPLWESQLNP